MRMRYSGPERPPWSRAILYRQIRLGQPPELREAYQALRATGATHQRALRWIIGALKIETAAVRPARLRRRDLLRRLLGRLVARP